MIFQIIFGLDCSFINLRDQNFLWTKIGVCPKKKKKERIFSNLQTLIKFRYTLFFFKTNKIQDYSIPFEARQLELMLINLFIISPPKYLVY